MKQEQKEKELKTQSKAKKARTKDEYEQMLIEMLKDII